MLSSVITLKQGDMCGFAVVSTGFAIIRPTIESMSSLHGLALVRSVP